MQVKFYVAVGIGEGQEEIVELPDDYIDDEIEEDNEELIRRNTDLENKLKEISSN